MGHKALSRTEKAWQEQGFGLLEALIALMLVASVGFTLLAWVEQNMDTLQRLRAYYDEQETRRLVAHWMTSLNPMETPEGEIVLGKVRLRWLSALEGVKRAQTGYPVGMGFYDVALYRVTLEAYQQQDDGRLLASETFLQAGYQKVRASAPPL
jgi:general secretion pathway protein I